LTETPRAGAHELPSRSLTTVPRRTVNFLRTHGIGATLRKIRAHVNNALFDRRYGVQSDQWVAQADLKVVGNNQDFGGPCQPIKPLAFEAFMDQFRIPSEGSFVDFGSGAGRALMMAALSGFRRLVGVEFATDVCAVAEQNLETFRRRTDKEFEFRILNLDASDYQVDDDDRVFFFYNPFDRPVLEPVLANIRRSYEAKPRPIHLVYGSPWHRNVLDDDPFWRAVDETDAGGLEDFVYYRPR
jgi:SAM-dependent methyltransferase